MKAVMQPVSIGRVIGDRTVITKGLDAGVRVVTDGQSRLVPNAKVEIAAPLGDKPATAKAGGGTP